MLDPGWTILIEDGLVAALLLGVLAWFVGRTGRRTDAGTFAGRPFGIVERRQRGRWIRTVFIAANDLAPRFCADRGHTLDDKRPYGGRVDTPDELPGIVLTTDEEPVFREAMKRKFGTVLARVFASADVLWVICIPRRDIRRMLFQSVRYRGPESDLLILERVGDVASGSREDVAMLCALADEMNAAAYGPRHAAPPGALRLLASGAWHTFVLFWLVLGGLALFFFICFQIAARF